MKKTLAPTVAMIIASILGVSCQNALAPTTPDPTPPGVVLSALSIVDGDESVALSVVFAGGTTAYTARLPHDCDDLRVYATPADVDATVSISVGDVPVSVTTTTSDGSTDPIYTGTAAVAVGLNDISVVVTSADGSSKKTYTIGATRVEPNLNPDATLVSLSVTANGSIVPLATEEGKGGRVSYSGSVAASVTSVVVTATGREGGEIIYGNGPVSLASGENRIRVVVTAADGTAEYTFITITRGPVATLSDYVGTWTSATSNPVITLAVRTDGTASYQEAYNNGGDVYEALLSVDAATGSGTLTGTTYRSYETYDYDSVAGTLSIGDYTYTRLSGGTATIAGEWQASNGTYTMSIHGDGTLTETYNGTPARTGTGTWDATWISFDGQREFTRDVLIRLGAPTNLLLERYNETPILTWH